jgi:2-polyprenyl-3-methyl-5-hydroxy-6-metoxy-1,4-benzoquinol methylase
VSSQVDPNSKDSERVSFGFGKNWLDYSKHINDERIDMAVKSLERFFKREDCVEKSFLDIGCGSGLFSLAALKLGFKKVIALDIDLNSVQATTSLLSQHMPNDRWQCYEKSVFTLDPKEFGHFDVVYSWGVLHHTGDMRRAIRLALDMVKPEGKAVLALYRKTLMCGFWTWEKRMYNNGPFWFPFVARIVYKTLYIANLLIKRKNILGHIFGYQKNRGMNWHHDVIDWIGGYPYESISPEELDIFVNSLHFKVTKAFTDKPGLGLFGSGCDEFMLEKTPSGSELG